MIQRPWTSFFLPLLIPFMRNRMANLHYTDIKIQALWFQQYYQNSFHGWHTHGNNWTSVYYLDLPDDSPKTELIINDKLVIPEISEGDIITFPSHIIHRAAPNKSSLPKTIISWNMDTVFLNFNFIPPVE